MEPSPAAAGAKEHSLRPLLVTGSAAAALPTVSVREKRRVQAFAFHLWLLWVWMIPPVLALPVAVAAA